MALNAQMEVHNEREGDDGGITSWTRGMKLGDGAYASVYIATNNANGELIVVKTFDPENMQPEELQEKKAALQKERRIMMQCSSPYIVKYLGWKVYTHRTMPPPDNLCYNLFMEYVQKGTVRAQIQRSRGRLPESIVACYIRDVLKGLSHLHTRLKCIHGDLKCSNMLVGPNNVMLCDFGTGKFMKEGDEVLETEDPQPGWFSRRPIKVTGTHGWMAPEVRDSQQQNRKSDIFSLGCCIVEMATGKPPYLDGDDVPWEEKKRHEGPLSDFMPQHFSVLAKEFVELCCAEKPNKRPDSDKLLQHQWVRAALPFPGYRVPDTAPKRKQVEDDGRATSGRQGSAWGRLFGCGSGSQLLGCKLNPFPPRRQESVETTEC